MPGERKINPQNPPRVLRGRKPKKNVASSVRAEKYRAKLAHDGATSDGSAGTVGQQAKIG